MPKGLFQTVKDKILGWDFCGRRLLIPIHGEKLQPGVGQLRFVVG